MASLVGSGPPRASVKLQRKRRGPRRRPKRTSSRTGRTSSSSVVTSQLSSRPTYLSSMPFRDTLRSAWNTSRAKYDVARQSKLGKTSAALIKYRKTTLTVAGLTFFAYRYRQQLIIARERDAIHPKTILLWRIHDGSIVEQRSNASTLSLLLSNGGGGSSDEPPRVMTMFEVTRALKFAAADERIEGIIADFSSTNVPQVPAYTLGLAQIEELHDAMEQLKEMKETQLGEGKFRTAAFSDSFHSQAEWLLATAFDEIYVQPMGEVAFTGLSAQIPFYSRLLQWIGIDMLAEARTEYKSMVAPYIGDELSEPQRKNEEELLSSLHDNFCRIVALNRFPNEAEGAATAKVKALAFKGPYTAAEAVEAGLIDKVGYKREIMNSLTDEERGGNAERKIKGFYHYAKTMEKAMEKLGQTMEVGVVYLLGSIGEGGEFGTGSVVKGLKEASEDDTIGAVVLRIDSGGGGVVESDTIHDAITELQEKGKLVVASFANAAASGGYLIATSADAILAMPSTITGSIGVASLRPTVTSRLLDRFKLNVQSFFYGSKSQSILHPLEGDDLARHRAHIDAIYDDFKRRVVEGRQISPELIELLAGGRVMTGSAAYELTAPTAEAVVAAATADALEQTDSISDAPMLDSPSTSSSTADLISSLPSTPTEVDTAQAEKSLSAPHHLPFSPNLAEIFRRSAGAIDLGDVLPALGPLGRGLVDGLGGLSDAAMLAAELYLTKAVQQTQIDNPGMSGGDALDEILPNLPHSMNEDGTLALQLDINLKRFPVEKSFWQTVVEQSQKGDSIDTSSVALRFADLATMFRLAATVVLVKMLSNELDQLGLGEVVRRRESGRGIRCEDATATRVRL